ncbi:MAG: T9SS type A sorting domain-containing protein [Bacteroidales bacterium]
MCNFDLSVTIDSLNPGTYHVKTYFTDIPYPQVDTIYIGLISFTISEQNSFNNFNASNGFQSNCYSILTDTEQQIENPDFLLYPDPAKNRLTISSSAIKSNAELSIFNLNGKKVFEKQIRNKETQIDISSLPRGVYFVRLQNQNTVEVMKMVKE